MKGKFAFSPNVFLLSIAIKKKHYMNKRSNSQWLDQPASYFHRAQKSPILILIAPNLAAAAHQDRNPENWNPHICRSMAALQLRGSEALLKRSLWSLDGHRRPVILGRGFAYNARRIATSKLSVSVSPNGNDANTPDFEISTLKYTEDQPEIEEPLNLYPSSESLDGELGTDMHDNSEVVSHKRKGAKIHDFCLGIPFGGIVFGGGLVGFLFSRTPATSMLSGAAILALGIFSLKVWRQGKSSLPFILAQAAITATLFWKHFKLYPSTRKIFPSGFYVMISAAMLCFYSYVLIAGGNPPPKKKLVANPSS